LQAWDNDAYAEDALRLESTTIMVHQVQAMYIRKESAKLAGIGTYALAKTCFGAAQQPRWQ
jgi:hypothetical protein